MNCRKCNRIPINGALYRQNPKGERGIFVCIECLQKPIPQEVKEVVDAISKTNSSSQA